MLRVLGKAPPDPTPHTKVKPGLNRLRDNMKTLWLDNRYGDDEATPGLSRLRDNMKILWLDNRDGDDEAYITKVHNPNFGSGTAFKPGHELRGFESRGRLLALKSGEELRGFVQFSRLTALEGLRLLEPICIEDISHKPQDL